MSAAPIERASDLDDAVARILRVKLRLGLFEAGAPSERPLGGDFERLASPEHRAVARDAVRQSLVLLKNHDRLLPLHPGGHILVAGDGANDMGKQTGGWSLTWQGTGTAREDFPRGETIWEGIHDQVEAGGGTAELAVDGEYTRRPDAAVVVFGEDPYAEFQGDLPTLQYRPGDDSDLALMRRLADDDIPVATGWEARMIEAEDRIRAGDSGGADGIVNPLLTGRGFAEASFTGDLQNDLAELARARAVGLWLTGTRHGTLRRLLADGVSLFPQGKPGTDISFPIPQQELDNNPNLDAGTPCPFGERRE